MYKINDSIWEQNKKERRGETIFYAFILFMVLLIVLVYFLNTVVFISVRVSGSSMESTLQNEDMLIVNKVAKPKVGDIIIIDKEKAQVTGDKDYWIIKRVIGVGGDTVEIDDGKVYRNGEKLEEKYLDDFQITYIYNKTTGRCDILGYQKIVLEADEIFYLGDNRQNSLDARINGPCKTSTVIGVVEPWSVSCRKTLKGLHNWIDGVANWFSKLAGCNGNKT